MNSRAVRSATIDIIDSCPSSCIFCYNSKSSSAGRALPFAKFKEIIERTHPLGRVNIGGGEPLLHRKLPRMLEFCLERNAAVDISTSCLIPPKHILYMARMGEGRVSMQVNAPAAEREAFRCITRTGDYSIFLENLAELVKNFGSESLRLLLTLCRENLSQLKPVAALAKEFGLPLNISLMVPFEWNAAQKLSLDEISKVALAAAALEADGVGIGFREKGLRTECRQLSAAYKLELIPGRCGAEAGTYAYFDAGGNEKGCEFLG